MLHWYSFPVIALTAWACVEVLFFLRRPLRSSKWWIAATWFARPLAAWSVFNIIIRIFAEHGFNTPATFPFYFNPWNDKETWMTTFQRLTHNPEFWRWSLVLLLLGGLFLLLCRRITSAAMTRGKVTAVPLVMVANALQKSEHPRCYFLMAVALSMLQYYGMRLFLWSAG